MSFSPYIPCNCRREGIILWPDFKDQLEIRDGLIDISVKYSGDIVLEKKFDNWQFCEHRQIIMEFSMAQSITGWISYVKDLYPVKFLNFIKFIPEFNDLSTHDYNKLEVLEEIRELKILEPIESQDRLNQFIELLYKAIEVDQNIYW